MQSELKMEKIDLPLQADRPAELPPHVKTEVFVTPGYSKKKRLMLLIQGR
jgi:hypothetical protein